MRTAGLVVLAVGGVLIWLAWQGKVVPVMTALATGKVPAGSTASATQPYSRNQLSSVPQPGQILLGVP